MNQDNMRILIFGGWFGSRNAGDEAILLGLKSLLVEAFPGSIIHAHSIDPDYTREVCDVVPVAAPSGGFIGRARSLAKAYRSMDLVVVSGGTPIFDYRLLSRAFHFLVPLAARVPMAFVGIGVKPVRSRRGKWLFRRVLSRAIYVSGRDPEVLEHLRAMGLTRPVELTADSAIVMEPAPATDAEALMRDCGLDLSRPIVAVAPIYLSEDYKGHYHEPVSSERRHNSYVSLARAADRQIELGRQVMFLPMHQVPPDDDREIIAQIVDRMEETPVVIEPPEDPRIVTALLHRADMLIGMRLHSLVLATSGSVPSVAIGFDMKVGGFMRYLGVGEYCHAISELTTERLIESADDCWANRAAIRSHLDKRIEEWREIIASGVDQMAALVGEH